MNKFNIVRHVGTPKKAKTPKGVTITRQERLFVPEWRGFVPCAPYDDHFIYENNEPDQSSYLCTCGSVAVIAQPEGAGRMFVCLNHATFGFHQTSQVNKKDFENGEPIIRKGYKWI